MQKDLKIGLALGLVLVASASLWLATRPSLSPIARMSHIPDAVPAEEYFKQANEKDTTDNQPTAINPQPDLPDLTKHEQTEKIKTQKFHIVLEKETLSSISQKYFGSPGNWKKILDANRDIIKDPNKLIPGTKLIIPN